MLIELAICCAFYLSFIFLNEVILNGNGVKGKEFLRHVEKALIFAGLISMVFIKNGVWLGVILTLVGILLKYRNVFKKNGARVKNQFLTLAVVISTTALLVGCGQELPKELQPYLQHNIIVHWDGLDSAKVAHAAHQTRQLFGNGCANEGTLIAKDSTGAVVMMTNLEFFVTLKSTDSGLVITSMQPLRVAKSNFTRLMKQYYGVDSLRVENRDLTAQVVDLIGLSAKLIENQKTLLNENQKQQEQLHKERRDVLRVLREMKALLK